MLSSTVLVLAASLAAGQVDEPTEAQKHLDQAMGWLIGQWTSEFMFKGKEAIGEQTIGWKFKKQYIDIQESRTESGKKVLDFQAVSTWDPVDKKIKGWGASTEGGYSIGVVVKADEKTLVFEVDVVAADGQKFTVKRTFTRVDQDTYRDELTGENARTIEWRRKKPQ